VTATRLALHSPDGKRRHRDGPLFKFRNKLDFEHLVPIETEVVEWRDAAKTAAAAAAPSRGFALTDAASTIVRSLDHANYCIWAQPGQGQLLAAG